jgi:PIN domain nuclease of toxin-antitoxin system
VSVAGLWELADKASKGKLPDFAAIVDRSPDGLELAMRESGMRILPVALSHIASLRRLPFHHRDPFDRMMIAQAVAEDLTLISRDAVFPQYANLRLLPA